MCRGIIAGVSVKACWLCCVQDVVSDEEHVSGPATPPDEEFEGIGDYEESFLAEWWQEPKTKGDNGENEP